MKTIKVDSYVTYAYYIPENSEFGFNKENNSNLIIYYGIVNKIKNDVFDIDGIAMIKDNELIIDHTGYDMPTFATIDNIIEVNENFNKDKYSDLKQKAINNFSL